MAFSQNATFKSTDFSDSEHSYSEKIAQYFYRSLKQDWESNIFTS